VLISIQMSFAIVEWLGTDLPSVSAVPCSWLVLEDGDLYSYWPPADRWPFSMACLQCTIIFATRCWTAAISNVFFPSIGHHIA
jgi:hypothetical protein